MDNEGAEWQEVKPKRQVSKPQTPEDDQETPRTPEARAQSFTEVHEPGMKNRIGRHARREQKLEWSASKSRERERRIEKREGQREAAAREREAKQKQ